MTSFSGRIAAGLCVAIGAWALSSAIVHAIERKALPAFTLTTLDGRQVSSRDLVRTGNWLLLSIRPSCGPCDTLLRTIDPTAAPGVAQRVAVVVVGADAATAARLASGFSDLGGIAWYVDSGGTMKDALPVTTAPVVFGMRESTIEWSLAGIVPDAASMQTALVSWISLGK